MGIVTNAITFANHYPAEFADLVAAYPGLLVLERRCRQAKPRDLAHLHDCFSFVHFVCAALPKTHAIVADCYLCGLLDDQAELHWST